MAPWDGTSYSINAYITTTASTAYTRRPTESERQMIDTPAFLQIDMLNGTKISGKFVRYTDPMRADAFGAFRAEGSDGVLTYVLWCGVLRITVFPLDMQAPEATPLEKPES